jgi:branched-chain amino acid transport system permease protein
MNLLASTLPGTQGLFVVVESGLATGLIYAALMLGIILVFQVGRAINFAYGEYGGLAALVAYYLITTVHAPTAAAIIAGIVVAVVLATATELTLMRKLGEVGTSGRDLLVTLGLLLFLEALGQQMFGANPESFPALGENTLLRVGGYRVDVGQVLVIVFCALLVVGTKLFLDRTGLGLRLRAVASRPDIASSVGLNVRLLRTSVWAVSGVFAACGAMLFGSQLSVDPFYMTNIIVLVFIAGMVGGLWNFWLPISCAVGLGVFLSVTEFVFGANSGTPAVFIAVLVILVLLPKSIVGELETERA